jgi:hypothetical protein
VVDPAISILLIVGTGLKKFLILVLNATGKCLVTPLIVLEVMIGVNLPFILNVQLNTIAGTGKIQLGIEREKANGSL